MFFLFFLFKSVALKQRFFFFFHLTFCYLNTETNLVLGELVFVFQNNSVPRSLPTTWRSSQHRVPGVAITTCLFFFFFFFVRTLNAAGELTTQHLCNSHIFTKSVGVVVKLRSRVSLTGYCRLMCPMSDVYCVYCVYYTQQYLCRFKYCGGLIWDTGHTFTVCHRIGG